MFDKLSDEELKRLILVILQAFYKREAERLQNILAEGETKIGFDDYWQRCKNHYSNEDDALSAFATFVMAQFDGGDIDMSVYNDRPSLNAV